MVAAVAFVPSPPFLLAGLGGGPAELRSACAQAISVLHGLRVVVVGTAPTDGWVTGSVDATPWGARGPSAPDPLPLALAVGRTLLPGAHELYGLAGGDLPPLEQETGLLVVGDGSARRTEKAPGYFDDRAEAFDAVVEKALAAGDPAALAALDVALGDQLLAGGLAAWRAAGRAAGGPWRAQVHYAGAPYGVGYVIASWTRANRRSLDAAS